MKKSQAGRNAPRRKTSAVDRLGGRPRDRLVSSKVITLGTILRRTATLVYRREFGLSQLEWQLIALVGEYAPISQNDLAEIISLDKGQLSRGVSALVSRNLLNRENRGGGRGAQITLSARAERIYTGLIESAFLRNEEMLADLDDDEVDALFRILEKLTNKARTIQRREQVVT